MDTWRRSPRPASVAVNVTNRLIYGCSQADVLARLRAGDIDALEIIYRTYSEPLLRLGYSLTWSRESAQDLVHTLFLTVWERRGELEIREDVGVYLRSALRHQAYKVSRHESVVQRAEAAALEEGGEIPAMGSVAEPAAALEVAEIERAFAAALATVPERDRRILTMRWKEGLTQDEIAQVLGISRARVRAIIAKQQERLRPFFEILRPE